MEAGVRVCSGSDGIRDTWGPYGNGDMLERAVFVGLRNNLRRDDELRLAFDVVTGAARASWSSRATASPSATRPIWCSCPAKRWQRRS